MTRAEKMIAFIETLRTPDGAGVGQPFVLRGWQKAIIREVYDAEDGEGRRVVRQAVLSMSRKNGKTALVAGLCLAHLCGPEAVRNGQLYSLAHDREQASVLFKLMTAMITKMKNRILAMPTAPEAIPPKPKMAATRAMMRKTTA